MRRLAIITASIVASITLLTATFMYTDAYAMFPIKTTYSQLTRDVQKEVDCMAENIYFEALTEGRAGQMAVALVTLNRLSTGNYSNSVCGVVKQRTNSTCQFSWYCDRHALGRRSHIINTKEYEEVRTLALHVMMNYKHVDDLTRGATYYHADYVNPGWKLQKTAKIGRHIFYKHEEDIQLINKGV